MQTRSYPIMDSQRAAEIAGEVGFKGDWFEDAAFANSFNSTSNPETLFRGYLAEYMAEQRSESRMLAATGYGEVEV